MIVDYNTGEIICPPNERGKAKSCSRGECNDPINLYSTLVISVSFYFIPRSYNFIPNLYINCLSFHGV